MAPSLSFVFGLAILFFSCMSHAAPAGTLITSLPGYNASKYGPLPELYGGYITVDQSHGRALYYILAKQKPSSAPKKLLFFFQGGPGCSGLYSFLIETGPLRIDEQMNVVPAPVTWTDFASVVYLEQPAGVGFSYSNNTNDYNTGDIQSTADNYVFVQKWLEAYPEFLNVPTWLTGESYGGEYVPTLAARILSSSNTQIYKQLAGIAVGNPVFFCGSGSNDTIQVDLFYWHGLVSYENYNGWNVNNCRVNDNGQKCQQILQSIFNEIGDIDQEIFTRRSRSRRASGGQYFPSLDPDNLMQDFCTGNASLTYSQSLPTDSCDPDGQRETTYLQTPAVWAAIHSQQGARVLPPWQPCSSVIDYSETGNPMVPLYQNFKKQKAGFQVLVYSGDLDIATVPFAVTQPCLAQIGSRRTRKWGPYFVSGNTAGYWEQFEDYTFATIKGSGHEAMGYTPWPAYHAIRRFITSGSLLDPYGNFENVAPFTRRNQLQGDVLRQLIERRRQKRQSV